MQPNNITFFQRFQDDILAGRKTITLAMLRNRTLKQAMYCALAAMKMTAIFAPFA